MRVFSEQKRNSYFEGSEGANEGLSPLYLQCLGIKTRHVHRQQGSTQKHTIKDIAFNYGHPSSNLCLGKRVGTIGIKMPENHLKSDNECIK